MKYVYVVSEYEFMECPTIFAVCSDLQTVDVEIERLKSIIIDKSRNTHHCEEWVDNPVWVSLLDEPTINILDEYDFERWGIYFDVWQKERNNDTYDHYIDVTRYRLR